jgi:hypothetical protein
MFLLALLSYLQFNTADFGTRSRAFVALAVGAFALNSLALPAYSTLVAGNATYLQHKRRVMEDYQVVRDEDALISNNSFVAFFRPNVRFIEHYGHESLDRQIDEACRAGAERVFVDVGPNPPQSSYRFEELPFQRFGLNDAVLLKVSNCQKPQATSQL